MKQCSPLPDSLRNGTAGARDSSEVLQKTGSLTTMTWTTENLHRQYGPVSLYYNVRKPTTLSAAHSICKLPCSNCCNFRPMTVHGDVPPSQSRHSICSNLLKLRAQTANQMALFVPISRGPLVSANGRAGFVPISFRDSASQRPRKSYGDRVRE